jgi:hypothetical protein
MRFQITTYIESSVTGAPLLPLGVSCVVGNWMVGQAMWPARRRHDGVRDRTGKGARAPQCTSLGWRHLVTVCSARSEQKHYNYSLPASRRRVHHRDQEQLCCLCWCPPACSSLPSAV